MPPRGALEAPSSSSCPAKVRWRLFSVAAHTSPTCVALVGVLTVSHVHAPWHLGHVCAAPMEFFEFQEVSAVNWAHHFGAQYISLEHRYYGESNPVPDYSTDNMRYLSSRQVCAPAWPLAWPRCSLLTPVFSTLRVTGAC